MWEDNNDGMEKDEMEYDFFIEDPQMLALYH